ncbi:MAG TPA: acyl-ACP--UDP-N-acetylglucosamine O-acyltransferase [Candidatus Sulfotelmatobacter sp.]|nr:acyl-ACP--UDP-N-acetylglucosamine O-acyltransferase [Candidatus Sulfotelmatobacter sp.]
MAPRIHPSAIIEEGATLHDGVVIGPYCCVGAAAELDAGVVLESHVVVSGRTRIGEATRIFPFASIGAEPQDLKYAGEASELVIGKHNLIRESVTMNPGTRGGGMITRVGDHCLFMANAHVGHDCQVGDNVVLANSVALGGHITLGDFAIIGGNSAVHQFVRVGKHAIVGGMTGVEHDVIPYGSVTGNRAHLAGLNLVGLKRRGFGRDDIHKLRTAYRLLFAQEGTLQERLEDVAPMFADSALVQEVIDFIRAPSQRGICQPHPDAEAA